MNAPEELMIRLMNELADKFKDQLILKGGILLRLLNSPRQTQDLDYCWIRTKKRNLFADDLTKTLERLNGIQVVEVTANSRGVFLDIVDRNSGEKTEIEISVEKSTHLPPKPLSNALLANLYSLKPHLITTMDLSEAFSHKIAAALERDLVRDLYDLMQMEPLSHFDEATLKDRLSRLEVQRSKAKKVSMKEGSELLKKRLDSLTEKRLKEELSASLPQEQWVGLLPVIRATVSRIIRRMEQMA